MTSAPRIPIRAAWRVGYGRTFGRLGGSLLLVGVVQGAVVLIASPLLIGVFDGALRAAGLTAVTDSTAAQLLHSPGGLLLSIVLVFLVVVALVAQTAVFLTAAQQRMHGGEYRPRAIASYLGARLRALSRRPSSLLLIPYLLLVVPLGHIGVGSALTNWIAVPAFVADELQKSVAGAALYYGVLAAVWYLNIRLVLTMPLLVLGGHGAAAAFVQSWRLTRWQSLRVVALVAGVVVPGAVVLALLGLIAVVPTLFVEAVAPQADIATAAITIGILRVIAFFVVGLLLLVQAQSLVVAVAPPPSAATPGGRDGASGRPGSRAPAHRRAVAGVVATGAVVAATALSLEAAPVLERAAEGTTTVLAHRGFTQGGVENTIPALDAAHAAHADVVEMDIQQTADGGWVLMHDFDLKRLAGIDSSVARMSTDQATAVTVRADGHEAPIPTLTQYLSRAAEIDQKLLIEVKVHGGESDGYIDELLAVLDEAGGAQQHIYHSLSADVVEGLTQRRPDLVVGYIVPISFGGVPQTSADFVVIEQGVYSPHLMEAAWDEGLAVFVWTVEDEAQMRRLFGDDVDGIITDRPDLARRQLDAAQHGTLTDRLWDGVDRLIVAP